MDGYPQALFQACRSFLFASQPTSFLETIVIVNSCRYSVFHTPLQTYKIDAERNSMQTKILIFVMNSHLDPIRDLIDV